MAEPRHYDEEIQEYLDGRLPADRRAELDAHLLDCPACRSSVEQLAWAKRQVAKAARAVPLPPALADSIRRRLDEEDEAARAASRRRRFGQPAWGWGLASMLLAALGAGFWYWSRPSALAEVVAADYGAYRSGRLPLDFVGSDIPRLESFFVARGVPFTTRVFDLGMMKYGLVGGRVHDLAGRVSALFVYRGEGGASVVCQMYLGRLEELPRPEAVREHQGTPFWVYRRAGVSLVFWPEGDVMCVLAGEGDTEALVQLAFAKAMRIAALGPRGSS